MKTKTLLLSALAMLFCLGASAKDVRTDLNIDKNWQFTLGDQTGAQQPGYNDSAWRTLDVPHDWSIEDDYNENSPVKRGGGYLGGGIGWYRKALPLSSAYAGKKIIIEFQGVMANSDVWVNGTLAGHRPIGYLPLYYDITDLVKLDGTPNTIAVRVDNTPQPASRWYAGAGIYRHVFIHVVDPIHIVNEGGVFITTPGVTDTEAVVKVETEFINSGKEDADVSVATVITSPSGKKIKVAARTVHAPAGQTVKSSQFVSISNPERWDMDTPNRYTAVTTLSKGGKVIDSQTDKFGIRTIEFKSEDGFYLNGRNVRIYGVCLHNDGGAVGTAVPASVWERRMHILKKAGVNAVRGAHCPMDPSFYEACDKTGMLLFDETFDTWRAAKPNGQAGYNLYFDDWWRIDAEAQIRRVRNHPSIFLYSLGNEIRDDLNGTVGRQTFYDMRDLTKKTDPTRPITMALFRPTMLGLFTNGFSEYLDVIGQNYAENILLQAWSEKPGRKIIGTENTPARSSWLVMKYNPQYSGQFLWTGMEYLGESDWPKISWNTALFNRNGGWKSTGWERLSWWSEEPMVRIWRKDDGPRTAFVQEMVKDYTPSTPNASSVELTVYSNCDEVELYRNGTSVGKMAVPEDDSPCVFTIAYEPGTVRAVGRKGGKEVAEHSLTTAGAPVKLNVVSEQSSIPYDWEQVVYVTASITDDAGRVFPNSDHKIKLSVSGPGELVSIDNNDVYSHERYKTDTRTAYRGEVIGIIRATATSGTIRVTATSDGLESGYADIRIAN